MNKKEILFIIIFLVISACSFSGKNEGRLVKKSGDLLSDVKRNNNSVELQEYLEKLESSYLSRQLANDASKKAFWLNIYNAYFQLAGKADSTINMDVFNEKLIPIAGYKFTFDEIEHGILRRQEEYGLEELGVDTVDYRIHFALNCGARSCPPIAFYSYKEIDQQLEQATKLYLSTTTEIDHERKVVKVTRLMDWFTEDFGGVEKIPAVIEKYTGEEVRGYEVEYLSWDWTAQFQNFK